MVGGEGGAGACGNLWSGDCVATEAGAVTAGGLGVDTVLAGGEDGVALVVAKEVPGAPAGSVAGGERLALAWLWASSLSRLERKLSQELEVMMMGMTSEWVKEVTKLDPRVFLVNNTAHLRAMFSAALATCRWE